MHEVAPAFEKVPARQFKHVPLVVLNVPALHMADEQELAPTVAATVLLAEHAVHMVEPPDVATVPAAHGVQLVDPTFADEVPAGQLTHWVPPVVSLYVPAAQLEQEAADAAEYEPTKQLEQLVAPEVAAENIPAAQGAHTAVMPGEYEPGAQLLQLEEPVLAA